MFSERIITDINNIKPPEQFFCRFNPQKPEIGGYQKSRNFSNNPKIISLKLKEYRQTWADIINNKFKEKGLTERVTAKSINTQIKEQMYAATRHQT